MDDFSKSVMIALLPTTDDWCRIELPHLTLVYAGETDKLIPSALNDLAKDAASLAMGFSPLSLKVLGAEVFGDEDKVDVYTLAPSPELLSMRHFVESWDQSEYPFKPHVTIGPSSGLPVMPIDRLYFNRLTVGWGKDYINFKL